MLSDEEMDEVVAMSQEGKSVRAIAEEIKLSRSKVHRLQARARREGRL